MSRIDFTADGRNYTLEFTRETVKQMEQKGFAPQKILEAPITYMPELFHGAFAEHHPHVTRKISDKIFYALKNREDLVNALVKMYNEPIKALTEDPDEGNGVEWEMN